MTNKVSVGTLDSMAKGTTARKNGGKPRYSLADIKGLGHTYFAAASGCGPGSKEILLLAADILVELGYFQRTGDVSYLHSSIDMALAEISMDAAIRVYEYGAEKYAAHNWMKGGQWSMALDCAVRHCMYILDKGEIDDEESGQHHLAHMICNCQMLILWAENYPEGNDLPPKELFV